MSQRRKTPYINVTWLKHYLIGNRLCRWSIWHRIHNYYQKKSNFDVVKHKMKHTPFLKETMQSYEGQGYEVVPEYDVKVYGEKAELHGKVDLIALREDGNLIIECKTGKPNEIDKIQLLLYIWALPRTHGRFRGARFDGILAYKNYDVEISSIEVDEEFVTHFSQFTTDIMNAEPDRKYPSPRECKWCDVGDCDERNEEEEKEFVANGYVSDFF